MRCRTGSSRAGKILCERCGRVCCKQCVRVESELAAEKPREEIEDAIEIEIGTEFQTVLAARVTDDVDELSTLDRRFTRTEVVSSQLQKSAAGLNTGFSDFAVGFARLAVTTKLKPKLVDQHRRQRRDP